MAQVTAMVRARIWTARTSDSTFRVGGRRGERGSNGFLLNVPRKSEIESPVVFISLLLKAVESQQQQPKSRKKKRPEELGRVKRRLPGILGLIAVSSRGKNFGERSLICTVGANSDFIVHSHLHNLHCAMGPGFGVCQARRPSCPSLHFAFVIREMCRAQSINATSLYFYFYNHMIPMNS